MDEEADAAAPRHQRDRRLQRLRIQRREQQEEVEAAVLEGDRAQRTLADLLRDHGERGDRCAVEVGPHRLVGLITHLGEDLVRVQAASGSSWDVALLQVGAVAREQAGRAVHAVGRGHPRSLLARARELAGEEAVVEVGRLDRPDPVRGRLVAVSGELLELDRGRAGSVVVAWWVVAWLAADPG